MKKITIKKFQRLSLLLLSFISCLGLGTANAQIGIGTTSPDASAQLELQSTAKGFLPPRMDTDARDGIGSPAEGLTIYNTDNKCLEFFTSDNDWISACDGSVVTSPPQPQSGSNFTNGFQDNQTCENKLISVTPCSAIDGASINDDPDTADGIEYDWADAATSGMANTSTTRALVEIGGQCWMRFNMDDIPSGFDPAPTFVDNSDDGWSGYYSGAQPNEGRLYQWSAAMNGGNTERAQGVCPTSWHVPSDCEWMYLENSLGMTTADQEGGNFRNSGNVGNKLSESTPSGNNNSGFTALLAGNSIANGSFFFRQDHGYWWSSSEYESLTKNALFRKLESSEAGVYRASFSKAYSFSVRCLKD